MTAKEFYKKILDYDSNENLNKESPLTHKGVIHLMEEYSKELKEENERLKKEIIFLSYKDTKENKQ